VVVGLYEARLNAGSSAPANGLREGIRAAGAYDVRPITRLDALTMAQHDIIVLADCHEPGRVARGWQGALRAFVAQGGGCLATYHNHWFGNVGMGVRRVNRDRHLIPDPKHGATRRLKPFDAAFPDHIVQRPGREGRPILRNRHGDPVATAGRLGKGRIITTGLPMGLGQGSRPAAPQAGELAFLSACLRWLTPKEPWPHRVAAVVNEQPVQVTLDHPRVLAGTPLTLHVAALIPADEKAAFRVRAGKSGQWSELALPVSSRAGTLTVRTLEHQVPVPSTAQGEIAVTWWLHVGLRRQGADLRIPVLRPERPRPSEVCAAFLRAKPDRLPGDAFPKLAALGVNVALVRGQAGLRAYYPTKALPLSTNVQAPRDPSYDYLADAIAHAHRLGMELHAWRDCWVVDPGGADAKTLASLAAQGRLMRRDQGSDTPRLCPSHPANRALEKAAVVDLARRGVDGVHLAGMSYPNHRVCFCRGCRRAFEAQLGQPVAQWPRDVAPRGTLHRAYWALRAAQLTSHLKETVAAARAVRPSLKVSASVATRDAYGAGQEWPTWAAEGLVDWFVAASYHPVPSEFEKLLLRAHGRAPDPSALVAGILLQPAGVARPSAQSLARQIAIARLHGLAGFVLYEFVPGRSDKLLAPLRETYLAGQPSLPWKTKK